MRIAITSNQGTLVTGHAGRCRSFLLFEAEGDAVEALPTLELAADDTLHERGEGATRLLESVDVLITGGMGSGLIRRCERAGVRAVITDLQDPTEALRRYLAGELPAAVAGGAGEGCDCSH
ncbi:MAG: NifB/NifX family molybdenum-iron cluster-binding protein [Deltaproteobacteria bacterium]|nr:NifB/NifX family molybdenum-iron cluster-binding protein [Deltaproteobacteria bacterium]